MTTPLPPLPPRPNRDAGDLPPISARPERTQELPRVERPQAAPKRRLQADPPPPPTPIHGTRPPKSRRPVGVILAVLVAAVGAGAVGANLFGPDGSSSPGVLQSSRPVASTGSEPHLEDAVRATAPSVVEIKTSFGLGSGVVVQPSGLIVTNNHVIAGETRVEIVTASGSSIAGEVVASDENQDLAIVRPSGSAGPGVAIAEDAAGPPDIGSAVFAIGSPFGLRNTVTAGVVSAFREDDGRPVIQFDAPVNPGNSGGGLFDLQGQLVGIPTSIRSPVGGNVGIGFAVPASRVRAMLDQVS